MAGQEDKSKYENKSGGKTSEEDSQNETDYKELYEEAKKELKQKDSSYTGLQGTVQKKDDALKALNEQHAELQKIFDVNKAALDTLTAEKEALSMTLDEKEIALDAVSTEAKRARMIMKEFPELAIFESKGLLPPTGPDDADDKVKELFSSFRDTMKTLSGKTAEEIISGGLPHKEVTSSSDETQTPPGGDLAKAHLDKATMFALKGMTKEYDLEMDLYNKEKYKGKPIENA